MTTVSRRKSPDRAEGGIRKGFRLLLFVVLSLPSIAPLNAAVDTEIATSLARAGAPHLAIMVLEQRQKLSTDNPSDWIGWERTRLTILREAEAWPELAQRVVGLPDALPEPFLNWARTERVEALLAMGEGEHARQTLLRLLWQSSAEARDEWLQQWRQLLIKAYLESGRGHDAYLAMLRYAQDYRNDGGHEAALLRARVLLSIGRAEEALLQLDANDSDVTAATLYQLASLRHGEEPRRVMRSASNLLKRDGLTLQQVQMLRALRAEAAQRSEDYANTAITLERLYRDVEQAEPDPALFNLNPDDLWDAYLNYAKRVGNREQLLIGNDKAWFEAAATTARLYPIRIRSIYALLAFNAHRAEDRARAHKALVAQLKEEERGPALIHQLYIRSNRFGPESDVPQAARYLLLDRAIKRRDLELASQLMVGLDEPPQGSDQFDWQLRRAKVFNLAGDVEHSGEVILSLVKDAGEYDEQRLDRVVQLIFDLQTIGDHRRALSLFMALFQRIDSPQRKRELLYWMGDSHAALEEPAQAAHLYLRSAILIGANAMDPWAQTARYQSAKALVDARLYEDAKRLYLQLIKATDDPARRAVILRDLEQIRLKDHER